MPPTKPFAKEAQRQEFSRRLRDELQRSGREASPSALAREVNLYLRPAERVHPSSCRKWLNAEAIPTQEKLLLLAQLQQVSAAWLRFGQVSALQEAVPPPLSLTAEELALLEGWRQLRAGHRRAVRLMMSQLLKSGA
ncbi:MAG: hypothetical protein QM527_08075 [Alphaproteobacteria bacterium]|nr:hypothetical protein [Alphaproteobacteria bacterium]